MHLEVYINGFTSWKYEYHKDLKWDQIDLPRVTLESRVLSQPPGLQIPLTQIPKPVLPHFVPSVTLDFLFSLGFVLFGRQYRIQRLSGLSTKKKNQTLMLMINSLGLWLCFYLSDNLDTKLWFRYWILHIVQLWKWKKKIGMLHWIKLCYF